uniref:Fe2OG dioxygenase domain-containing protein n=1 Tax=Ditylum brightwellii TaxID=49249 RepID=A0A6U3QIU4_9STRA|mmetsp:Transcript_19352/g.28886  ORF Transcript_19352/g.28886 Transcript_19352/m.28886 type:complete len:405 (+) Transcript_19352:186-1400(+)
MSTEEIIDDDAIGLHLLIKRKFPKETSEKWFQTITKNARWHRVKYQSGRFSKSCETPCWTTFYGGREEYSPYEEVPNWFRPLVDEVSSYLGVPFNAMLLRLYFDGNDEIAWHTDGRTFLGDTPTIASLSLGATATFQMRRMLDVWPPTDGSKSCEECIDKTVPQKDFVVRDGDLLVMRSVTQKHWHHRVPKEKGRRPRININFRYIIHGPDAMRGQQTYYKYMVHGDEDSPQNFSFDEIMSLRGGMMNFAKPMNRLKTSNSSSSTHIKPRNCKSQDIFLLGKKQKETTTETAVSEEKEQCNKDNDNNMENLDATIQPPPSTLDSETCAYLNSETDVDASIFLSLPLSIRQEQIDMWKSQKRNAPFHTNQPKRSTTSREVQVDSNKRKLQKRENQKTIDSFFGQR